MYYVLYYCLRFFHMLLLDSNIVLECPKRTRASNAVCFFFLIFLFDHGSFKLIVGTVWFVNKVLKELLCCPGLQLFAQKCLRKINLLILSH